MLGFGKFVADWYAESEPVGTYITQAVFKLANALLFATIGGVVASIWISLNP